MTISFRPLRREDFPALQRWMETPHVKEWWREGASQPELEERYGQAVDGKSATLVFVILLDDQPVGMIQSYRVDAYKEYHEGVKIDDAVGVDFFIGELGHTGKGIGIDVLRAYVEQVVKPQYPEARWLVASPSIHNTRSIRAFEKAGFDKRHVARFPSEEDPEQVMALAIQP
jgi:aminoglycoside 6'-N-acetyltransferase